MKILIEQKNLAEVLSISVRTAGPVNSPAQNISGVLLEAKGGKLTATTQNFESASKVTTSNVEILEEGSVLVNAHYFTDFISKLNGQINLTTKDNKLIIEYGRSKGQINTFSSDDLADPIDLEKFAYCCSVLSTNLKKAFQAVLFACASEHFRKVFTGVLLDIKEEKVNFVASDTHKLGWYVLDTFDGETPTQEQQIIIPAKTVAEVLRILTKVDDASVQILTNNNAICFLSDEVIFTSRLLEGQFPNYRAVVPDNANDSIKIETSILRNTLERVRTLPQSDKIKIPAVIFTINGTNEIKAFSSSELAGEIAETLPLKQGANLDEELKIGFNSQNLYDMAKIIGETTQIAFSGALSPVLVTGEDAAAKYVVVPLRM